MTPVQYAIRRAKSTDSQSVLELLRSVDLPLEGVVENLQNFIVAYDQEGRLIGVSGLELYGASGLLRSVAVVAEHRGEGLGHLLVKRSLQEAKERDVRRVYLLTDTAEKFMERLGFKRINRASVDSALSASAEFKGACPETAAIMLREE